MTLPYKNGNMKMQFTNQDMQITWKDIVLFHSQRNANFITVNDSEDIKD